MASEHFLKLASFASLHDIQRGPALHRSKHGGFERWSHLFGAPALVALVSAVSLLGGLSASAETMSGALARAYQGNPNLNQQRASLRATDENLPRASAGFLPTATATAQGGYTRTDSSLAGSATHSNTGPFTGAVQVNENIFNGNRTVNSVRQAESNILGARETLRNTEQSTLLDGSTAYMNVLRDTAILDLRKNNIIVLEEQLRQTRDRFEVGEVTRTDVAQAQASLASARSDYFTAQANLENSRASYRQVIGIDPSRLEAARPIEQLLPHALPSAIEVAFSEHPAIQAALHNVDVAELQVKLVEGELYPTVGIVGQVQNNTSYQGLPNGRFFNASVLGQISVPIYAGGEVYARARQSKELLSQARLQADQQRDSVRAVVVSSWNQLDTAKAVILSSQSAVKAAEIALNGIREEARVGQRTTFDVLTAQQTLLNARVSLVTAQRDRIVASYTVMAAIGRLTAANLNLVVTAYDPTVHFDQVKDKWIGLRTPDGR
jgi:outer membrane protein